MLTVYLLIPSYILIAHLGGFLLGLLVGTTLYPVISVTKRHRLVMWTFRIVAIPIAIVLYVVLTRNFYTSDPYAGMSAFYCVSQHALHH